MIDMLRTEPLFVLRLNVGYDRASLLGEQAVFPVLGGTFAGERLNGVVEGGADWVRWRGDGAMLIDVRLTLRTDAGAAIGMTYEGLAHAPPETMARFRSRDLLSFADVYVRTAIRFATAAPDLDWLNATLAIGQGMRTEEGPIYHVFAIR